ncbi:MAG: hydroxylamine reductase [Vampirovibrionales bacterium]|nr:hydroxylamine reductase [Vampirovibrionales bacterium]
MFCYQCEQTSRGTGCTTMGICGKEPETAALQDLMLHAIKGISMIAHRARALGVNDAQVNRETFASLFLTLTNVNFDKYAHVADLRKLDATLQRIRTLYADACKAQGKTPELFYGPAEWRFTDDVATLLKQGEETSIPNRLAKLNPDVGSMQELIVYGIKGLAAYAHHACMLSYEDDAVYAFVHEALDYLTKEEQPLDVLVTLAMRTGECNLRVMEMLDRAHTETFGHPVPSQARLTPKAGKAIVVSGHDLKALYELLKQTEGKGVNVYTHGEMLPALGYPGLKRFSHLIGHYGGPWQNQQREFAEFPGAILMTTNCLKEPLREYNDRIFTMDVVGWEGVQHIEGYDYSKLIARALEMPGFPADVPEQFITVGFGHNAVLSVADKVLELVKAGKINHFYVIGGCDGAESYRDYFTRFATSTGDDSVILTMGCGKYRFNKLEFGDIEGIPRLLDLGQCNDSYSAVKIAVALAEALDTDVNSLPLSLVVSWFEQKAVAVLLTLLHLGLRNIRLGPALPAFISPNVLELLVSNFNIMKTGAVETDLAATRA